MIKGLMCTGLNCVTVLSLTHHPWSTMPWMVVVILLTLLDTLSSEVACIQLADIYWNATNPIFRIDNTDHIIDVNKGNVPFEYDQVNIICPSYPHRGGGGTSTDEAEVEDDDTETYIIYNVSKEEYDSCRITNPNPRIIAVCDRPNQVMYFTITFRSFTPQPGGLEFIPGHDYYFVSTSTGSVDGLHQMVGGRCATHNMKVIFKVCCKPDKGVQSSRGQHSSLDVSLPVSPSATKEPEKSDLDAPDQESDKLRNRNILFPPRHQNTNNYHHHNSVTSSTSASVGASESATPRWMRPLFPSKVTPLLPKQPSHPYEVPIEDEMARPPPHEYGDEILGNRDQLPNKARSKNEEFVNSGKASTSGGSSHWTSGRCRERCFMATLVFQLILALLWR